MTPPEDDAEERLRERFRAKLAPTPPAIDAAELAFAAGRASVVSSPANARKSAWFWPAYSAAMTATAAGLALRLAAPTPEPPPPAEPATAIVAQAATEPAGEPAPAPFAPPAWLKQLLVSPGDGASAPYLAARRRALRGEPRMAPPSAASAVSFRPPPRPKPTARRLLEELGLPRSRRDGRDAFPPAPPARPDPAPEAGRRPLVPEDLV